MIEIIRELRKEWTEPVSTTADRHDISDRQVKRIRQVILGINRGDCDERISRKAGWGIETVRWFRRLGEEIGAFASSTGSAKAIWLDKHINQLTRTSAALADGLKIPTVTELSGINDETWKRPFRGQLNDRPQLIQVSTGTGSMLLEHLADHTVHGHIESLLNHLSVTRDYCHSLVTGIDRLLERQLPESAHSDISPGMRLAILHFTIEANSGESTTRANVERLKVGDDLVDLKIGAWSAGKHSEEVAGMITVGIDQWVAELSNSVPAKRLKKSLAVTVENMTRIRAELSPSSKLRIHLGQSVCGECDTCHDDSA